MKRLIGFVVTLLMPLVLIGGGGALVGVGVTNEWPILAWAGLAMIAGGVLWGLFLFFWASEGPF